VWTCITLISNEALHSIFGTSPVENLQPRYNIAPSQQILVVRNDPDNHRHLAYLKWGLIPHWAKDMAIGSHMINARSETVEEKPSFRSAFRNRRCIVQASGFYEATWSAYPNIELLKTVALAVIELEY